MTCQQWKPGTDEFVPHDILADYIQDSAESNGITECISFNTRVNHVRKIGQKWEVEIAQLSQRNGSVELTDSVHVRRFLRSRM